MIVTGIWRASDYSVGDTRLSEVLLSDQSHSLDIANSSRFRSYADWSKRHATTENINYLTIAMRRKVLVILLVDGEANWFFSYSALILPVPCMPQLRLLYTLHQRKTARVSSSKATRCRPKHSPYCTAQVSLLSLLILRRLLALADIASSVSRSEGKLKACSGTSGTGLPKANLVLPRRCLPIAAARRYGFE